MATWRDLQEEAARLPLVREELTTFRQWRLKDVMLAWERPLRPADLRALGESAPMGTVVGFRTIDLAAKERWLARGRPFFTTPHFDGHPAVLVTLEDLDAATIRALLEEIWGARAPKRVVAAWAAEGAQRSLREG